MNKRIIIITGASGFLGSAITVELARDNGIIAIDRREPTKTLREAAPEVKWEQSDIAEAKEVISIFQRTKSEHGRVDFVIHFAAFYHFGTEWLPEYERTNIQGMANVLQAAKSTGVQRVIFASSIAAMKPPSPGCFLTEKTPTCDFIPYAKSKSIGEEMIAEAADDLSSVVLRIGGAFSDWCELPPLYSLIKLWTGQSPFSRLLPGNGESGIPYIHRNDLVRLVRTCIYNHDKLDPFEVFIASQQGAVLHKHLFPAIRQAAGIAASLKPIHISPTVAKFGLHLKCAFGALSGKMPFERPWMLGFVDRPWEIDTTYTHEKLGWSCTPSLGILDRLPVILERFITERRQWEERNRLRNEARYAYLSSEI